MGTDEIEIVPSTELEPFTPQPTRIVPRGFSLDEVTLMADSVARSGLFPGVSNPASAFSLMMLCQSEGLHPMQALKRYHIIEGRPTMRADAIQAEFQRKGGRIQWIRYDRQEARAVFSHPEYAPDGVELGVTFEEFNKTGMTTGKYGLKDNWKHHPDSMLRARLISKGVRMIHPGIVSGVYTPEEASDFSMAEIALPPARPPKPQNNSGHKTGQYASDEQVESYRRATLEFCAEKNAQWVDEWTDEHGEIAEGIKELIHPSRMTNHLMKYLLRSGKLAEVPATIDPETGQVTDKVSSEQAKRYVAIIFAREPQVIAEEGERYFRSTAEEARKAWREKYGQDPDEMNQERVPGRGDAWEPD